MKKYIISLVLIIVTISTVFLCNYIFINQLDTVNPIKNTVIDDNNYYVEKGLEDIANIVKPAAENYLNQDISESINTRNQRLSVYFTSDSPVYKYNQDNINTSTNKSTSKIFSVTLIKKSDEYITVKLLSKTTSYQGDNTSSKILVYWVKLVKIYDGSMVPYDIGELNT